MADLFISYKAERRAAAEHLAEVLADCGYSVWWDYSLVAGKDFAAQIETQLRAAKAVVVLWCSQSVNSEWVREEATLAKRLGKSVPILIEAVDPPLGFSLQQYIDLSAWDGSPISTQLQPLLREIARLAGPQSPQQQALERSDRAWRRFGAPSLKEFALSAPVDPNDASQAKYRPGVMGGGGSIAQVIRPGLPLMRRYSRLLTHSQSVGDGLVAAMLETIIADTSVIECDADLRTALYMIHFRAWSEMKGGVSEKGIRRAALLLGALEGFSPWQTARIIGRSVHEIPELVEAALTDVDKTSARILIIEDEAVIAVDLTDLATAAGHVIVGIATTASAAVEAARRSQPDLVLADIQLADGSSGIDAVNEILSEISVPVVFITAFPDRLLTSERSEPTYLITKPYSPDMIRFVIAHVTMESKG